MRSIPSNGLKVLREHYNHRRAERSSGWKATSPEYTRLSAVRECQRGRRATTTPSVVAPAFTVGVDRRCPSFSAAEKVTGPQSPLRGERQPAQFICHGGKREPGPFARGRKSGRAKDRALFRCDGVPKLICGRCTP